MIAQVILFPVVALLNILMYTEPWGSAYLSIIIILIYFAFRPREMFHPNNVLFAFYGLYIVLPSTLNLGLYLVDWEYVLPWGQQVFWNEISKYVLFQAEFTFLLLFFGFHHFSGKPRRQPNSFYIPIFIDKKAVYILSALNIVLVIWFLESTAGVTNWISDYSYTYLTKREGHGLLNIFTMTLGNALVFILGVWTQRTSDKKIVPILIAVLVIGLQSYMNGFKGRLILLLLLYFAPWLMLIRLRLTTLVGVVCVFFGLLYSTTLVRTEGFYASAHYFLEMLIGYFNAYQLHDLVVTSRDPDIFQTVWQIFIKPMQVFGFIGAGGDFDISVMLTKEYFPDQWDLSKSTQQWPLDTELYLNYYGFYLAWIPLLLYSFGISKLFLAAMRRKNIGLMPVYVLEFLRIFSALRGTLIPWEIFFMIVQYPAIYIIVRHCVRPSRPKDVGSSGLLELQHA